MDDLKTAHTRKRIDSYGAVLHGRSCRIFQTLRRLESTSQGFGWIANQESAWSHCFYGSSHQTFMRAPCVSATVLLITVTQDLACPLREPPATCGYQHPVSCHTPPVLNALYLHEAKVYLMEQEKCKGKDLPHS